jgi:ribosome-associated heat shock protein Hsp15
MEKEIEVRIDKFLWAVRLFKTRSIATDACKNGKILIASYNVKPSRIVNIGDIFEIKQNPIVRKYRVKQLLHNRIGAKLVADYIEEITSIEELKKLEQFKEFNYSQRDRGTGRPTKKERRDIDSYFDF